jgi:hypothetical protein
MPGLLLIYCTSTEASLWHTLAAKSRAHYRDWEPKGGVDALPDAVRQLMWFYDNLGLLVVHGVVEPDPVISFVGGSAMWAWERLEPFIRAERATSDEPTGGHHYQEYFENLVLLARDPSLGQARIREKLWRL